jgi:hypothetical protein
LNSLTKAVRMPSPSVNPDASSAWLLSGIVFGCHRTVARRVGAPVTLVSLGRIHPASAPGTLPPLEVLYRMTTTIGSEAAIPNPALKPLSFLVGEWRTEGSHPQLPGKTLHGIGHNPARRWP